ncbi:MULTISPECIES: MaoC family dehydratase [Pseudomonas]|jgi:3-hydroxybutyryl-CoA dehydratase|uniref:MaoC family dehydratase N-terminal domain-containing protein n=1 Tax=Pseudomonas fragi TaxID=296 RepID=A0A9Q6YC16_PSEFR|nr:MULTISPECIES: MaoC/PaaZ C-terminal domain-containing protein [Pseudomonas]AOA05314.1 acyl dehydratase [Pseudomonas sp. TMW 2.1634]ARQ74829.1 acyl dehydratase [Pseudomonas fragi]ASC85462.1 acyl dehydratase [Pseudomonas fragi]MDE4515907.1 acyl dehydratase [Pseudomonas fragi]NNA83760.1 acyl dehydratase [Pseudomonas fragi]
MNFLGKAFDEISEGETFGQSLTIDASHISRACGMFGDFNPLHSDAEFCANSRFGRPILHGPMTSAFMSASIGMYFYGTAVAYLEHNCRFVAPVFAGDTLSVQWTITQTLDKPRSNGGIAVLRGECSNQRGEQIAEASGKILLSNRALLDVVQAGG